MVGEPKLSDYQDLCPDAERREREEDYLQYEEHSVTRLDDIGGFMHSGQTFTSFNSSLWTTEVFARSGQTDEAESLLFL